MRAFLLVLVLLVSSGVGVVRAADTVLTLGVFAYRPKPVMIERFAPLAEYLSEQLPGIQVRLLVLEQEEMEQALTAQQLDLVLTNPSHYLVLRSQSSLSGALATLISMSDGQPVASLGGVIITRADRDDIARLGDLRHRRIAVPGTKYLGGYQTQAFELLEAGIELPRAAELIELGGHDAVIEAVLAGSVDAGFVRTGVIESLAAEGRLDPVRLKVINPQRLAGFPYRVSTRLYPEWPFIVLPHVDRQTVRLLAAALLSLPPDHPAARAAGIAGFDPPADYYSVEQLAMRLNLPPYDKLAPILSWSVIWQRYRPALLTTLTSLAVALMLLAMLVRRNRALRQARDELLVSEHRLRQAASVFEHANEAILITDPNGDVLDVNAAFCRLTGYQRQDVVGKNARFLKSGRHEAAFYADMWADLVRQGGWTGEIWNRRRNGELFPAMLTISAVRAGEGGMQGYVALFSDISAQKAHQRELEHIAHYDALTRLPNRVLLGDRLRQAMSQASRREELIAVLYIDLDGFKAVNDQHGHDAGDRLLVALAARMKHALREGDTLARLGGDEFVAVLVDLPNVDTSLPLFERLLAAASQPVQDERGELRVSASIGATFYPQAEPIDADQLLRQADQAMYQAKLAGKHRYHLFDADHDRDLRGQHESIERLRKALENNEFVLHYQPKVNLRNGQAIGVEALIRWQHPEHGLLPPGAFLPILEQHPLMIGLTDWVIDRALAQIAQWHSLGIALPVSVNVDALAFAQPDFVGKLAAALQRHPTARAACIELEVLESSALHDIAGTSEIIRACQALGVRFSLDDFGTGYSSLTYLKRLPVDTLKIDQSFVRDMLDDPDDLAILEGVLGLAATFRRQVIAEGVETEAHGEMLLHMGCSIGQGYAIARPMPAERVPGWLLGWRPSPAWAAASPVARELRHVLFAMVEHRAWSAWLHRYLSDEQPAPPSMDHRQCHFGQWLEDRMIVGDPLAGERIRTLHEAVHRRAEELVRLKQAGEDAAALARFGEVRDLRDQLLEAIRVALIEPGLTADLPLWQRAAD